MATRIGSAAAKGARLECEALVKRYGLEGGVPANIDARLRALADVKELIAAETLAKRIGEAMFSACMAAVAGGRAEGEDTPESLERQAKSAEALAKMLEKKEDDVGARHQRKRASELRTRMFDLAAAAPKAGAGPALKLVRTWKSKPTRMYPQGGGILFEEWV